jgi:hypothetical protein
VDRRQSARLANIKLGGVAQGSENADSVASADLGLIGLAVM